ncbi:MAG: acyl-CoA dehydrogenase family protein [Rhodospirillales bacterium]|jgi:alkylation response protein AidB-like acyl-CoA dehydrogenase
MHALPSEAIEVQNLIRRVASERIAPRAAEIDKTGEYPQDMFDLLKELGIFTLPFPNEYGGQDSLLAGCVAVEELGRVCYNTGYLLVVQWTPFGAIMAAGTKAQKDRYLPGLASGELRAAFSITEPQSGSDVAGIKTRANKTEKGWHISGAKIWCTNALVSDFIVLAAKTGESRGDVNFFIVPTDAKGLQIGPKEDKLGARGVPSSPLYLDDVLLPEDAILGDPGKGFRQVMGALALSRPIIGARAVGLAQGALDLAMQFMRERRAFDQPLTDFQGLRWMLADMEMQIEAARGLVYKAAAMTDAGIRGKELAHAAAISKAFASDMAMKVATDAVQIFGASGISNDYPINRYFRDAKVVQIIEGSNQIQRNIIAKNLIDGID